MTAAIVSPVDPLLLRYGLKLRDLPVQGVATHRSQDLGGSVHRFDGTAGNIIPQALSDGGNVAEPLVPRPC